MTDEKRPTAEDKDQESSPFKGDLTPPPSSSSPTTQLMGSLAPPLARHTTPPDEPQLPTLNYGTVHEVRNRLVQIKDGNSARIELPRTINTIQPAREDKVELELGNSVPISIRCVSSGEIQRMTTEGGEGFAQLVTEQRGGIILKIDDTEVLIEDLRLSDIYDPSSLALEDLPQGIELRIAELNELKSILNNPEHSQALDKIIQELKDREHRNAQVRSESRAKAEKQHKDDPIRLYIGRKSVVNPETSKEEQVLTLVPVGLAAKHGKVKLLEPIAGMSHKETKDVGTLGLSVTGIPNIDGVSRAHLVLELKHGQLTLVDGDGQGKASSNGTWVVPH